MTISIQKSQPEDAEALVEIQIAAFHHDSVLYPEVEEGGPPGYDSVESTRKMIEQADSYKILQDQTIVGGMVIFDKGEGHYHLDLLFLDPAVHNMGIGTLAMEFLEQTYSSAKRWTLDTPQWAVRNQYFYEKFGYVKVGEHYEASGVPLFAYEKRS